MPYRLCADMYDRLNFYRIFPSKFKLCDSYGTIQFTMNTSISTVPVLINWYRMLMPTIFSLCSMDVLPIRHLLMLYFMMEKNG